MFLNQNPRWLVSRGLVKKQNHYRATRVGYGDVVEVKEIQNSLQAENTAKSELFFQKRYFRPISLAVLIAMFNQLSGINAILYYAPRVFEMAGFEKSGAMLSSFGIGFVMLIFTLIALVIIDHFGRKNLMIWGSIGYILSLAAVAVTFHSNGTNFTYTGSIVVLISIMIFIAAHGFGQGAVIWVFISEIFPNKVRARGQSLGSFTHWFMAAIVSWTFPVFAEFSGGHVFTFYMICMILQLIWVVIKMPETGICSNWKKIGIDIKFNLNYEKNKFFNMCLLTFGSGHAQEDEFNVRVISDHIYTEHLYRDKIEDPYRPLYHYVIQEVWLILSIRMGHSIGKQISPFLHNTDSET